jgi:hypothetical protein
VFAAYALNSICQTAAHMWDLGSIATLRTSAVFVSSLQVVLPHIDVRSSMLPCGNPWGGNQVKLISRVECG